MKKVRCLNSHWFDADEYNCCPHCGAEKITEDSAAGNEPVTATEEKPKKKGFFWGKSKTKSESRESEIPSAGDDAGMAHADLKENPTNSMESSMQQYPKTDVLLKKSGGVEIPQEPFQTQKLDVEEEELQLQKLVDREETPKPELFTAKVRKAKGLDDIKTVSIYANAQGDEPVTGWIVGITGEYRGNSFQLKAGVNVIAGDAEAYVCLKRDTQVSRACHAKIVYEPKKKVFYLGEGENSLTYCNEELVNGKILLAAYDVIEIGGGKYLFIPFCGERFDWEKEAEPEGK